MGLSFSLKYANWAAYLLSSTLPPPIVSVSDRVAIAEFITSLPSRFISSDASRESLAAAVHEAAAHIQAAGEIPTHILDSLWSHLRQLHWFALLVPSSLGTEIDRTLQDYQFLVELVRTTPTTGGLVLQIEDTAPSNTWTLDSVFPAFKQALAFESRWPGILLWNRQGETAFLSLAFHPLAAVQNVVRQLVSLMAQGASPLFLRDARPFWPHPLIRPPLRIIHVSDLHLGSRLADERIGRVEELIRLIRKEPTPASETASSTPLDT